MAPQRPAMLALVGLGLSIGLGLGLGPGGCYRGFDVEDKQPPPGYPGGRCLPAGCVDGGECYMEEDICIDPLDPCKGIYCAGFGTCILDLDTALPACQCDPGYSNEAYTYFCIPAGL